MENNVLVEIKKLHVTFGHLAKPVYAVRGVDLRLESGQVIGIVGESGCGKSVTSSSLFALDEPNKRVSGQVLYRGEDLAGLSAKRRVEYRRKALGLVSQEPSLSFDPIFSIYKCFEETFRLVEPKISKQEVTDRAVKLLEMVEISNPEQRLRNFPHQFSGGMLQRIMIALSLANNPEILVADEPTTALDVTTQSKIIALLKGLQSKRKLAMIFISHDINLVADVSDMIVVMYGGIVLEQGPKDEVLGKTLSPYTEDLLLAMPKDGQNYKQERLYTIKGAVPDPQNPPSGCPYSPRCKFAEAVCSQKIPEFVQAGDSSHYYRCVLRRHQ
ncbi:MAG: ABC transporter ATP-binding protein [Spirochaetales bacterium]|nr:ABC transporter ATP-binding protein [Spirochaetales bacterium]